MIATSTWVLIAIQTCVFTAFSLVPQNALIRRFCLIHLKNSLTCQRDFVQPGDRQCRDREVVRQEHEPALGFGIVVCHAPQGIGMQLRRLDPASAMV